MAAPSFNKVAVRAAFARIAFPYGICAVLLAPSLYWILRDRSVWLWDQSWYGEMSVDLWYLLVHHPSQWLATLAHAFGIKAPGIAWIGEFFAPAGQAFGSVEVGLLLSVLAAQFTTLVLTFKIGKLLAPAAKSVATVGALMVASAPLFVAMGHQYMVESMQLMAITYFFWIAVAASGLSRLRLLAHLVLASAIAMLAKSTSPLYCVFPGLVAGYGLIRTKGWVKDRREKIGSLTILLIGILSALAALSWYAINFAALAAFMKSASAGASSLNYGHVGTFGSKLLFWLHAARASFFVPYVPAVLGALAAVSLAFVWTRGMAGYRTGCMIVVSAVAEVLLVVAVFCFQISEETRYLLPILPAVAVILMWVLSLGNAIVVRGAACVLAVQFILIHSLALDLTHVNLGVSLWLMPYQPDATTRAELRELVRRSSGPGTEYRYNVVGVELPWLNANALDFYAAQGQLTTGRRNYFISLGYAETDTDRAWNRMEQLRTLYYVTIEANRQPAPPDFLNQISVPILNRVMSNSNFDRVSFPSDSNILLFRRLESEPR